MPDIYTTHPEIVRSVLEEAGLRCGVEPQILNRLANETCQLARPGFLGELYIHPLNAPNDSTAIIGVVAILAVIWIIWHFKGRKH